MTALTSTSPTPRVRRKGQWCWLDTAIVAAYGPQIGAYGIAVYVALATHASHDTQTCFPSIKLLARETRLSRTTVKTTLRRLEALGLVTIQARRDGEGDPTSNLYTLTDPTVRMLPNPDNQEEGGSPHDLPPVATRPTGGSPHDPEPAPYQPEEKTSKSSDVAVASKGKEAKTVQDETSSWQKRAVLPPMTLDDRPETHLEQLALAPETYARLYAEAETRLRPHWPPILNILKPAIHTEMLVIYEEEHAPRAEGGAA
jgi:DNA-binding MarR family transcriptional regulator